MNTEQLYNILSPYYAVIDFFLQSHKRHLISAVNAYPAGSILEVGVGHGNHLKQYKSTAITAIDISEKMLVRAIKNNPKTVQFIKMNALELFKLEEKFDFVVLSHILSTSSNGNKIIESCSNALKTNGKLIVLNHFTANRTLGFLEKLFQPIAKLFHFQSYFPLEKLTALNVFSQKKALKFGFLNSYQLLIFEKT